MFNNIDNATSENVEMRALTREQRILKYAIEEVRAKLRESGKPTYFIPKGMLMAAMQEIRADIGVAWDSSRAAPDKTGAVWRLKRENYIIVIY